MRRPHRSRSRSLRLLAPLALTALLGTVPVAVADTAQPGVSQSGASQSAAGLPTADRTVVTRRADGTILQNGRPYFPVGFYHLSWAQGGTAAQRRRELGRLGADGFNFMLTEPVDDDDVTTFADTLDEAGRRGLSVIAYGLKPDVIGRLANHPAVLGFETSDDAPHLITPAALREKDALFHRLAPDKFTYISVGIGYDHHDMDYFGLSDCVGDQVYPVGNDSIAVAYPVMRMTVTQSEERHVTPLANIQAFSWSKGPPPSAAEIENITYQALMAGIRGIIFYAYRSPEVDLAREPQTYAATTRLAREIAQLRPALLDGTRAELSDGRGQRPLVVTFDAPGGRYLLALSTDLKNARTVGVRLPFPARRLTPMFGRGEALSLRGGAVSGQLGPLEVEVYRVE